MTQESQPSEKTGTKPIKLTHWHRFWANGSVFDHNIGKKLSEVQIIERLNINGFSPVTQNHVSIYGGHSMTDVYVDHPLYNKLYPKH